MKKILPIILSIILVCGVTSSALAKEKTVDTTTESIPSIHMTSKDKISFAAEKDILYNATVRTKGKQTDSQKTIDDLLFEISFANEVQKDALLQQLSNYGVYLYNNVTTPLSVLSSDNGDVKLSTVSIYYSSSSNSWIVSTSGYWLNNNWLTAGLVGDKGDKDCFGVSFINTSNYGSTSITGKSAYITDQNSAKTKSTSNTSTISGQDGFAFELQDYTYNTSSGTMYVGYKWYGACTYSSNFANFNGTAVPFYIHTYDEAYISSLTLGVDTSSAGISVTIVNRNSSFTAHGTHTTF